MTGMTQLFEDRKMLRAIAIQLMRPTLPSISMSAQLAQEAWGRTPRSRQIARPAYGATAENDDSAET